MNELFFLNEDSEIEIAPEAMAIIPFRNVMNKYTNKYHGILELIFIGFMLNPKSDYADIRDLEERKQTILVSLYGSEHIKIDEVTEAAMEYYKSRNHSTTTIFLDSALDAIDKLSKYFRDLSFDERDDKGNLVYDPKRLVDVISASPKLMASLRDLKEQIRKEQEMEQGVRGSGQKGIYEDGN